MLGSSIKSSKLIIFHSRALSVDRVWNNLLVDVLQRRQPVVTRTWNVPSPRNISQFQSVAVAEHVRRLEVVWTLYSVAAAEHVRRSRGRFTASPPRNTFGVPEDILQRRRRGTRLEFQPSSSPPRNNILEVKPSPSRDTFWSSNLRRHRRGITFWR